MVKFIKSQKFRTRLVVTLGILIVAALGLISPDAIGLRITYCAVGILALFEINAISCSYSPENRLAAPAQLFLCAVITISFAGIASLPRELLFACLLVAYGSDAAAYLVGSLLGKHSRHPFPKVSPSKTLVGTFAGIVFGFAASLALFLFFAFVSPPADLSLEAAFALLFTLAALSLGGVIAMLGDLFESAFKRAYGVKDSCDMLKFVRGFRTIERLLGGENGHGGYLDRIDSLSFVVVYTSAIYWLRTH